MREDIKALAKLVYVTAWTLVVVAAPFLLLGYMAISAWRWWQS